MLAVVEVGAIAIAVAVVAVVAVVAACFGVSSSAGVLKLLARTLAGQLVRRRDLPLGGLLVETLPLCGPKTCLLIRLAPFEAAAYE